MISGLLSSALTAMDWWIMDENPALNIDKTVAPYTAGEVFESEEDMVYAEQLFYPVRIFESITEFKKSTEDVFSKAFAEAYLYDLLEGDYPKFIEIDGILYVNIKSGGVYPYQLQYDSIHIIDKNALEIITEADFLFYDTVETYVVRLVYENDSWKVDSLPIYGADR
jgi:hypothetical protein